MIRNAKVSDFPAFLELGKRVTEQSDAYRGIQVDRQSVLKMYGYCTNSALGFAMVGEREGALTSCLLGIAESLWWSRSRYASDLIFYSERAGDGLALLRRFLAWAWSIPGVVEVTMGQSTGIETERTAKLYERAGLAQVGGLFHVKRPGESLCLAS